MSPLNKRPLDCVYFIYFTTHIIFTLFCDSLVIFPLKWIPSFLVNFNQFQVKLIKDPFMNIFEHQLDPLTSRHYELIWFRTFVTMEFLLQLPFFFYASYQLYFDNKKSLKIPGIIYCSHVATTVLPLLATFIFGLPEYLFQDRLILFMVYSPYLFVPLVLLADLVLLDWSPAKAKTS
ncbi:Transmembrane protein 97 [Entomophthora muscae]|uniref:Transmembrane protein 97 n=1 Tax=Entomophthora muscae TaxID=34485 RepID=A0ACC2SKI6_9FUNG|nr:Transmembrane protein 97 [Entomophthora muscae]